MLGRVDHEFQTYTFSKKIHLANDDGLFPSVKNLLPSSPNKNKNKLLDAKKKKNEQKTAHLLIIYSGKKIAIFESSDKLSAFFSSSPTICDLPRQLASANHPQPVATLCSSFSRENGQLLLICSSLSTNQTSIRTMTNFLIDRFPGIAMANDGKATELCFTWVEFSEKTWEKPTRPKPRKRTWPLQWKITIFSRRYIFKWLVFHCHVSFRGA